MLHFLSFLFILILLFRSFVVDDLHMLGDDQDNVIFLRPYNAAPPERQM